MRLALIAACSCSGGANQGAATARAVGSPVESPVAESSPVDAGTVEVDAAYQGVAEEVAAVAKVDVNEPVRIEGRDEPDEVAEAARAVEPEDPNGDAITYEDGVAVVSTTAPGWWCSTKGKTEGVCVERCRPGFTCKQAKAFACFSAVERTTRDEGDYCFVNYGRCEVFRSLVEADGSYTDVTDCRIVRVRPKVRVKPSARKKK